MTEHSEILSRPATLDYEARPPRACATRLFMVLVALVSAGLACWILTPTFLGLTKNRRIVDRLNNPQVVTGWTIDSLILSDGSTLRLNDVTSIISNSSVLNEILLNGVEISRGRVWGLIQIHHWCGNDPVGYHIARIDIQDALLLAGQAQTANPAAAEVVAYLHPPIPDPIGAHRFDPGDLIDLGVVASNRAIAEADRSKTSGSPNSR
jgi:hypothetical protein